MFTAIPLDSSVVWFLFSEFTLSEYNISEIFTRLHLLSYKVVDGSC